MTYAEVVALLGRLAMFGMSPGLERTRRALSALGNPERAFPALHVAGSNGKGSTCAFAAAALSAAGNRVGVYTSPHLESLTERIAVGGAPISEERFARAVTDVLAACPWGAEGDGRLTYFELVTAAAFLVFAEERVDVAVLETGLGGRLDATTCCEPEATAITPLSLEHVEVLGPTLAHIAREKAGIVKEGVPCVTAAQPDEALAELRKACDALEAPLLLEGRDFGWEDARTLNGVNRIYDIEKLGLLGPHQRTNAAVAVAGLEALESRGVRVGAAAVVRGLADARWPGRLEVVRERPLVVLDGAHNAAGAQALAASLRALWPGRRVHLVFGVLADKDAASMLRTLLPLVASVELVRPASPRALDPATLLDLARSLTPYASADAAPAPATERALARATPNDVVLVAGSLYLVGEVRRSLRGLAPANAPGEQLHARTHQGQPPEA